MDKPIILVVDGDPKNLQILKESLEDANFEVATSNNGSEAWTKIQSDRPDVIVCEVDLPGMDGFALLEKLQNDSQTASLPIIFLTNRRALEDRLRSLRSGVKDYMIKPLHVKEVIARLQMILRRVKNIQSEETETTEKMVGRLQKTNVEQLVERFGSERATGVLAVHDDNHRSGEIYFKDGAVINARLGNFKAEKAVYQMLPWQNGNFSMTFREVEVNEDITVSNLGLLLQGLKRNQEKEILLKKLPPLESVLEKTSVFQTILKKKPINSDAQAFISLFDSKRTLGEIISASSYDDMKTLDRISRLYEQGFITSMDSALMSKESDETVHDEPLEEHDIAEPEFIEKNFVVPPESEDEEEKLITETMNKYAEVSEQEVSAEPESTDVLEEEVAQQEESQQEGEQKDVQEQEEKTLEPVAQTSSEASNFSVICNDLLESRKLKFGHLLILSSNQELRQKLMSNLANDDFSHKRFGSADKQELEIAKISSLNEHVLEVFGLSPTSKALQLIQKVAPTLVGCIVLVESESSDDLGYLGYLINFLKTKLRTPFVIAIYHPSGKQAIPSDLLQNSLQIQNHDLFPLDNLHDSDVKQLLKQLLPLTSGGRSEDSNVARQPAANHS